MLKISNWVGMFFIRMLSIGIRRKEAVEKGLEVKTFLQSDKGL